MRFNQHVIGAVTLALASLSVACGSSTGSGPGSGEQSVINAMVAQQFNSGYSSGSSAMARYRADTTASFTFSVPSATTSCPTAGTVTTSGDGNVSINADNSGNSNDTFAFDMTAVYTGCQDTGSDNNVYEIDSSSGLHVDISGAVSVMMGTSGVSETGTFTGRVTSDSITVKAVNGSASITGSIDMTYTFNVNSAAGTVSGTYSGTEFGQSVSGQFSGN